MVSILHAKSIELREDLGKVMWLMNGRAVLSRPLWLKAKAFITAPPGPSLLYPLCRPGHCARLCALAVGWQKVGLALTHLGAGVPGFYSRRWVHWPFFLLYIERASCCFFPSPTCKVVQVRTAQRHGFSLCCTFSLWLVGVTIKGVLCAPAQTPNDHHVPAPGQDSWVCHQAYC